ncbi:MAG: metallophosphoesterase family protein [Chloroflexi bacterium]|nr:metallophosphoesterase family protein [Chloroflexota bacterium]
MRVGLISDTHIPEAGPRLPDQVYQAFRGVDLILHAGDMHVIDVLDWLETIAPVLGARGNGDHPSSMHKLRPGVPDDPRVRESHVLELEGFTIGLTHGFPAPDEVPWTNLERLMGFFFGKPVDIVVCGDTHVELIEEKDGVFMVNPGSPTLPHNLNPQLGTVAILELSRGTRRAEIIHLKDVVS